MYVHTWSLSLILAVRLASLSLCNEKCLQDKNAGKVYQMWRKKVFRSRALSIATKVCILQTLVFSVLLYGAQIWTVTQHDICNLCDFLGITLWNQVQNTDSLERMRIVPVEKKLRQRRLQWLVMSGECLPAIPKDSY